MPTEQDDDFELLFAHWSGCFLWYILFHAQFNLRDIFVAYRLCVCEWQVRAFIYLSLGKSKWLFDAHAQIFCVPFQSYNKLVKFIFCWKSEMHLNTYKFIISTFQQTESTCLWKIPFFGHACPTNFVTPIQVQTTGRDVQKLWYSC